MTGATMQWAKRLSGVSFLLLLVGLVSYHYAMPSMFDALDPEQNRMLELEPGASGEIEIVSLGEYSALRLEGNEEAALRLVNANGVEDDGSAPTALDFNRPMEDGVVYVVVRVFRTSAAGEYTLHNDGESTLWFVDDISPQASLFTEPWVLLMMMGCCLGPVFGVIGLILALIGWGSRGKENAPVVLNNQGELPTTEELYRHYHGIESKSEGQVPDPFSRSAEGERVESEDEANYSEEETGPDWKGWDEG